MSNPVRTIYKYPIDLGRTQLALTDPKVLHVANQHGTLYAWIELTVIPNAQDTPNTDLSIIAYGTGHMIEKGGEHVGSIQDGQFVWHFYAYTAPINALAAS